MGKLRSVNTHFWSDNYIIDLDPIEKLLFLYLLTNENTNMIGVYEIHVRKIVFDTGIDRDMVLNIFERFNDDNKVSYMDGFVIIHNFTKHQSYNTNMKKSAITSFNELPDQILKLPAVQRLANPLKPLPKDSPILRKVEVELEVELEVESEGEGESRTRAREVPASPVTPTPPESVEEVIKIGNMKTVPPEACEIYFHMRSTDNFYRTDQYGNWKPILNWHSDLYNCYKKGFLDKQQKKSKNHGKRDNPDPEKIKQQLDRLNYES